MIHYSAKNHSYYSFLLRLRCLESQGEAGWRISLEQVDNRRVEYFNSLPALMDYLQRLVVAPAPPPPGGDEGTGYEGV
jgi:hypothetical protein